MYCLHKWCHLLVWHTSATVSCGPTYKGRVCAQMMRMRKSCCWFGIVGARWIDVHPIADLKFTKSRLASRFIAQNCRLATLFYSSLHSSNSNSSSPPLPLLLYVALNQISQRVWIHALDYFCGNENQCQHSSIPKAMALLWSTCILGSNFKIVLEKKIRAFNLCALSAWR